MCFVPLLTALVVYVLLGVIGGVLLVPRLPGWLGLAPGGRDWWAAEILGTLAFVVLWVVLFSFVFVLLAGMFSGLLWERLSLAVEQILDPGKPPPIPVRLGCRAQASDTFSRLLLNGVFGALALVLSLALGPIPGLLTAALVGLLDFTSPAYLRRGYTLGPQMGRLLVRPDRATMGFAFTAGLLALVPLVGVFLMPGLVAGGTLLARRREGRNVALSRQ